MSTQNIFHITEFSDNSSSFIQESMSLSQVNLRLTLIMLIKDEGTVFIKHTYIKCKITLKCKCYT